MNFVLIITDRFHPYLFTKGRTIEFSIIQLTFCKLPTFCTSIVHPVSILIKKRRMKQYILLYFIRIDSYRIELYGISCLCKICIPDVFFCIQFQFAEQIT